MEENLTDYPGNLTALKTMSVYWPNARAEIYCYSWLSDTGLGSGQGGSQDDSCQVLQVIKPPNIKYI